MPIATARIETVRRARSAMTKQPAMSMSDLSQQYGVVVFASEEREAQREKGRVAGQADPGWPNALSVSQTEDAVVEPVLGDVAVDQRIAGYVRKAKIEDQTQRQRRHSKQNKPLAMLQEHAPEGHRLHRRGRIALWFGHVANIASVDCMRRSAYDPGQHEPKQSSESFALKPG